MLAIGIYREFDWSTGSMGKFDPLGLLHLFHGGEFGMWFTSDQILGRLTSGHSTIQPWVLEPQDLLAAVSAGTWCSSTEEHSAKKKQRSYEAAGAVTAPEGKTKAPDDDTVTPDAPKSERDSWLTSAADCALGSIAGWP